MAVIATVLTMSVTGKLDHPYGSKVMFRYGVGGKLYNDFST
ncbi:MAG: hypothetical protein ACN4GW_04710 [Desulforhopalus sp.]